MFWLSSYVTSHHLAMVLKTSAKGQYHNTIYAITLNPICVPQVVSKILKDTDKG
jgi:hypothetical protein